MHRHITFILAAVALGASPAQGQKPLQGGTVVASEPGRAAMVSTVEIGAVVTGIDKTTRTITLKGPKRTIDVVAGEEVRNFDQIKVGDNVMVKYVESLSLELKKTKGKADAKVEEAAVRAKPGSTPAAAVGRQVTVLADVVGVDQKNSTISLKGPRGNIVDLKVENRDHFKVVKKGDQVEAVYTEALAISVTPAVKAAAKK